jgi:hypothetical protein
MQGWADHNPALPSDLVDWYNRGETMALDHGEGKRILRQYTFNGRRPPELGRSGLPAPPLPIASLVLLQPRAWRLTRWSTGFISEAECGANTHPISRVTPRHYLGVFLPFGLLPRYHVEIRSPNTQTRQTHRNMVFGAGHSRISNTLSQIEHPNEA